MGRLARLIVILLLAWTTLSRGKTAFSQTAEAWTVIDVPVTADLNSIAVGRTDEVWAVGDSGVVLRGRGPHWESIPSPVRTMLNDVAISQNGEVWIAGSGGVLLSYGESAWERIQLPESVSSHDVRALALSPSGDVWIVGERQLHAKWNGEWDILSSGRRGFHFNDIVLTGPDTGLVVGSRGVIVAFDDAGVRTREVGLDYNLVAAAIHESFAWIGGGFCTFEGDCEGYLARSFLGEWSTLFGTRPQPVVGIAALPQRRAWIVSTGTGSEIEFADGASITNQRYRFSRHLSGVVSDSAGDAWVVGSSGLVLTSSDLDEPTTPVVTPVPPAPTSSPVPPARRLYLPAVAAEATM